MTMMNRALQTNGRVFTPQISSSSLLVPLQPWRSTELALSKTAGRPRSSRTVPPTQAAATLQRGGTDSAIPDRSAPTRKVGGKTAIITGGSQGCGKATAMRFAKEGYNVVIVARDAARVDAAAQEVAAVTGRPGSSLGFSADITREADVAALVEAATNAYETIDVVVNNAGVCMTGPLEGTSLEDFRQQMDINFFAAVAVTQGFLPALKQAAEKRGSARLAYVNSFGGKIPLRNMSAYTASKFALAGFVDAIRPDMQQAGIQVAQIHPGLVNSDFLERAQWRGQKAATYQASTTNLLQGGPIVQTPAEVAEEVWQSVSRGRDEVFVGGPFKAIWAGYKTFGINPFLLSQPEVKEAEGAAAPR